MKTFTRDLVGADHFGERFLADFRNNRLCFASLPKFRHQEAASQDASRSNES